MATTRSAGGRRSRRLTEAQRERLDKFRKGQRDWSWPQMLLSMSEPPFGLQTLLRAAAGGAISEKNHHYLVEWLDRALPARPMPQDGKSRAAGERDQENGETPEIASASDSRETDGQDAQTAGKRRQNPPAVTVAARLRSERGS